MITLAFLWKTCGFMRGKVEAGEPGRMAVKAESDKLE